MAKFRLSPNAARSIAEFDTYTKENFGPKQAQRYLESLLDRLEYLAEHPEHGKKRDELKDGYNSYFVGSHTVYYRLEDNTLEVIDVLHQSMEPKRHLPE